MLSNLTSRILLFALEFYRRFISPIKGFKCAYGVETRTSTCSLVAKKALKEKPLTEALSEIADQLEACGDSARRISVQDGTTCVNISCSTAAVDPNSLRKLAAYIQRIRDRRVTS